MPLRVLFVTNMWPDDVRPWRGTFVKRQAESLEAAGVSVDTVAIRSHLRRSAYLTSAPQVVKLNRDCPYDLVHAHYGYSALVGRLQLSAPLVITYWGTDLNAKPTHSGASLTLKSRIEVAVFRQLARVAAASMTQSDEMELALPLSARRRNHVVPAGIDLERFRRLERDVARRRLGWDLEEKVILFAANPELATKNFPLAQEVHRRAAATVPGLRLRVAWGLEPEEMPTWMSAADALLFTSRLEGSPNVVKEAMASELPVVATPAGDVEKVIGETPGCAVRAPDPQLLSEAVVAALDHGRAPAARRAVAPLALPAVARRIVAIYESVLGRG